MLAERDALLTQISHNTVAYRIKEWVTNFVANVPKIQGGFGVASLTNAFQNKPCIIVGSGPTLDRNVHLLKELQNRACIIACDSALQACLDNGVTPHFILCTDSKKKCLRFLNDVDLTNINVICDSFVHPEVIEVLQKGKRLYWYNTPLVEMEPFTGALNEWTGYIGHIGTGGCVATTIWSFIHEVLDGDPIILVGLPEAFYDKFQQYATSVIRNHPMEYYESETVVTTDVYGDVCYTKLGFQSFAFWFQDAFIKSGRLNINCSEGGIIKENCCVMPLSVCADRYLTTEYDVESLVFAKEKQVDDMMLAASISSGEKYIRPMMTILLDGPSLPNLSLRMGLSGQEVCQKIQWMRENGVIIDETPFDALDKDENKYRTLQFQLRGVKSESSRGNMRPERQQGVSGQELCENTGQADGVVLDSSSDAI